MALMIVAHPNYEQSVANKTIVEELQKTMPDLEVRNIHQLYPTYQININAEQNALLRHDVVILQYPMYWFNMPAILKVWFDQVLAYQFAYGSKGDKLKSKKILPSLTVGQPEKNFISDNRSLLDDFLCSIKKSAEYTQMDYLNPIVLFDISDVMGHSDVDIRARAIIHSQKLKALIHSVN